MGFSTTMRRIREVCQSSTGRNPFQGGMGFSTGGDKSSGGRAPLVAIPFRVGWGFRLVWDLPPDVREILSQSLSGWDGVFDSLPVGESPFLTLSSQSLSGWDGVFDEKEGITFYIVVTPSSQSLSGWDGVFDIRSPFEGVEMRLSRNPFQGGMGFSTGGKMRIDILERWMSQSLSGWDGVFDFESTKGTPGYSSVSQSLSGWDGVFDYGARG